MTPRSILIVDDEQPIREMLEQTLVESGHRVVTAGDGREASQVLGQGTFDLLITDLLMPDRDGLELIGAARRLFPSLRIIAMTGGGHIPRDHYLFVAKNLGAHQILAKPFEPALILAAIEEAFAGQEP